MLVTIHARAKEDTTSFADCLVTIRAVDTTTSAQIKLAVSPVSVTIQTGQTQQFQAFVTGSTNTSVRWKLVGGPGVISSLGLYSAPLAISGPRSYAAIVAISLVDSSVVAQATIAVEPPESPCFRTVIQPMIVSNCAVSGCHNPTDRTAKMDFTTYDGLMVVVVPGDTAKSGLYNRLQHVINPLTKSQIAQVTQWILGGAPNSDCDEDMSGCDTDDVHYSTVVKAEIGNYCVGCHSGKYTSLSGVDLTTYEGVQSVALSGQLVGAICHQPLHPAMPKYCPQLDSCTTSKLVSWVNHGAPND